MRQIHINLKDKSYCIYIQKGLINSISDRIKEVYKGRKIVIVTDENVNKYYGNKLINILNNENYDVNIVVLPAGEKTKCINELVNLYNKFLDCGVTRSDLIIAFGGGVIGDLTGLAAATYLRGVNFIQIPTSLISQIDSSVGGKVAVDLPRGKNLVGNFYHPDGVFIDPLLLRTLDKRFLYDGMGEVIKCAVIKDKKMFDNLMSYNSEDELFNNIEYIIENCCNIKKSVVEKDEKDNGERMILNFGHTFGHVVEKNFNYEKYTHGEAVAIGMYFITKKSEKFGFTHKGTAEAIKNILIKYNLPYNVKLNNDNVIRDTVVLDKKRRGQNINLVLLRNIGEVHIKKFEINKLNLFKKFL